MHRAWIADRELKRANGHQPMVSGVSLLGDEPRQDRTLRRLRHAHALVGSELHVISGAPHGCILSHADEFNQALLTFLAK